MMIDTYYNPDTHLHDVARIFTQCAAILLHTTSALATRVRFQQTWAKANRLFASSQVKMANSTSSDSVSRVLLPAVDGFAAGILQQRTSWKVITSPTTGYFANKLFCRVTSINVEALTKWYSQTPAKFSTWLKLVSFGHPLGLSWIEFHQG